MLAAFDRLEALVLRTDHVDDAQQRVDAQPRVPAGHPDGGQWTTGGGGGTSPPIIPPIGALPPPGIGHNQGPPLDDPPKIPAEPPKDRAERLKTAKESSRWLARPGQRAGRIAAFLAIVEGTEWLSAEWPSIRSYMDRPKSLEELIAGAQTTRAGYHGHHNVEQAAARADGFPDWMINGEGNVLSVPIYRHREISAWYQTKSSRFGNRSPRDFLRGKSWSERELVGHFALRKFGVLKR